MAQPLLEWDPFARTSSSSHIVSATDSITSSTALPPTGRSMPPDGIAMIFIHMYIWTGLAFLVAVALVGLSFWTWTVVIKRENVASPPELVLDYEQIKKDLKVSSARRAKEQHASAVLARERKKNATKFKIPSLRFRSSAGSKEPLPPALPNTPTSFDNGFGYKPLTPRVLGAHSEILTASLTPTKSALKQTTKPKSRGVSWAPANRVRLDTGGDGHELLIDESCLPTHNLPKALRPLPIAHLDPAKSRKRAFSESTSPPNAFASGESRQSSPGTRPYRYSDPSSNSSYFRSSPSRHPALGFASPPIDSPGSAKRHLHQYVRPLNKRLEALKMKDQVKWDVMPTKAYAAHDPKAQGPYTKRRGQNRSDDGSWRDNRPRYESAPVVSQSDIPSPSAVKTQRHSESSLIGLAAGYFPRLPDSPGPTPGLTNNSDIRPTAGTDAQSNPPVEVEAVAGRPSPMTSFSRLSSFSSSHAMDMAKEDPSMYYYPSGAILPPTPNEWTIVCEESGEKRSFGSRLSTPREKITASAFVGNPFEDPISPKADQSFASASHKDSIGSPDRSNCSRSSSHSKGPGSFHRDRLYDPMSPVAGMTKLQQALLETDTRWRNSKIGIVKS